MNAKERIDLQKERTYYKKVGRRYLPVSDFETAGLMEGWFLVHKQPGCTSYMSVIYPHHAEIDAAIRQKSDELVKILDKHMKARPTRDLTQEQHADWEALNEKHPEMFRMVEYGSLQSIAEEIIKEIKQ